MRMPKLFNALVKQGPMSSPRRVYGFQNSSGTRVTEDSCMESSAFYRGVIYLSGQIAKLPWEVKDKDNNVLNNDLSYLLNVSPNGETTAMRLRLFLIQCALITGNGYCEIERDYTGRVLNLWPLDPRRVTPVRLKDGQLAYEIFGGGIYGDTVYLRPKDVYHVPNLHMVDSITGQSIVAYAEQALGIALGADKFANALFTNGGLPSGVLKYKGTLDDEAFERLKKSWKEQQGGRKTGSTAILEDGVEYSPISHSPDILQFLESRKFGVTEIARFLGIPPQKLFDTDSAKYSNMEQAQLEVATDTLDTWCRNLEAEADFKLLSGRKGGNRTEFDLYAVYRGDMGTRGTYFQKMQQTGSITSNEIRKKEGMSPYKEGDKFYIATNNLTPVDRVDEVIDAQVKPKEVSTDNNNTDEVSEEEKALTQAAINFLMK